LPPAETEFINIVSTAQRGSPQAQNDMQRGGLKATRDEAICKVLTSFAVENWIGTVTKVDANSDGKGVLYISLAEKITLTTWNNDLSDIGDNTLIQPGTELFRAASSLKEGQKVLFSGSFLPKIEGCINESSITLSGKLEDPDFIFRFSGVAPFVAGRSEAKPTATEDAFHNGCVEALKLAYSKATGGTLPSEELTDNYCECALAEFKETGSTGPFPACNRRFFGPQTADQENGK
jgi:hypothetical protein